MRRAPQRNSPAPIRVAVIHHERESPESPNTYLMDRISKRWQQWGYDVQQVYGPDEFVPADLAVLHVDLSVTPEPYLRLAARYPSAINAGLRDIRKRTISQNLVSSDDGYEGSVIVKTDLNSGGRPEALGGQAAPPPPGRLQRWKRQLGIWAPFAKRLKRRLCARDPFAIYDPSDYLVCRKRAEVPRDVFGDPRLVVEKFLPERHGRRFFHRRYYFLGDAERNEVWSSRIAVNAGDLSADKIWTAPVPRQLRELHSRLGADFGKIDYVIRDGQVTVFDVNRTPGLSPEDDDPKNAFWTRNAVDALAPGIA